MHGFTVRFENALPAVEDIRSRIDMKSNLCRRSAQIALNKKAFMGGNFQWNKNDRYVVSVLWSEG